MDCRPTIDEKNTVQAALLGKDLVTLVALERFILGALTEVRDTSSISLLDGIICRAAPKNMSRGGVGVLKLFF
jgi:hypothetical protein